MRSFKRTIKPTDGISSLGRTHDWRICTLLTPTRYDYEEVSSEGAHKLVANINDLMGEKSFVGSRHDSSTGPFEVANVTNFSYTDPIDGSVSKNQGHIILFSDGSRIVFRLSGTGSQGATVRMYVERYTKDESQYTKETAEGLKGLIEVALQISKLKEYLQRDEPSVITVSILPYEKGSLLRNDSSNRAQSVR